MATNLTGETSRLNQMYAGEELMRFSVAQMPPNTKIYIYCNGVDITPFCAPAIANANIGDDIITNQLGNALGWLYIPSSDGKYKFLVGEITLTFSDSSTGVENSKYISEATFYNHGLNLVNTEVAGTSSLRATEKIKTSPLGNTLEVNTTQLRLDPLAQTFIVDAVKYPLGIYLTGVSLFVYEKDPVYPLAVELRQVINGTPSTTEVLSGSFAILDSADIGVYDEVSGKSPVTNFTFQHPIYLRPGEWAFCVMTKSARYSLLSATNGNGRTVKQSFAGRLFKAQNTGNWVGDDNEDLTFILRKAVFQTGTVVIEAKSLPMTDKSIEYNRLRLLSSAIEFADTASIKYKIQTTSAGSRDKSLIQEIQPGVNADLTGRQVLSEGGDLNLQIEITSKSKDISPMIDKQLLHAQVFKTYIEEYSEEISNSELKPSGGLAAARYISKPVSLAQGFDSTGLEVKIDISRQVGTDAEVYCRVLARNDKTITNGVYDRPWIKMPLINPDVKTFAGTDEIYSTETYRVLEPDLGYTTTTNNDVAKYEDFGTYQVKVVFYSGNPVYQAKLKSLSAISLI
jgi:hypothetical protein